MDKVYNDRRRFLKGSAALAGLAAVGKIRSAHAQATVMGWPEVAITPEFAYGTRSRFETVSRIAQNFGLNPTELGGLPILWTPLQDQKGIITPSSLHFTVTHGLPLPDIDPGKHSLMIHGLVDRPLVFSMDELQRLPSVTRIHFLECNSNSRPALWGYDNMPTVQHTHGFTSCSEWTGVLLSTLLEQAGVQNNAKWIVVESAMEGKHSKSIPLSKAMADAIVAYGQNGEALRPHQGYPVRLVCPGFEGLFNVKHLRRIKVVDGPYMTNYETSKYVDRRPDGKVRWFRFEMPPKSVITRPSGGQRIKETGFYQISGLAWSGGGAIKQVEVSVDGGKNWKVAELENPVLPKAHTKFRMDWNWNGEETVIMSRCTDDVGQVQPTLAQLSERHHVSIDIWTDKTHSGYGHFNAIQSWKVGKDGGVHNAMFS
jgi:sulfane dehydrogenase subunit SoxC